MRALARTLRGARRYATAVGTSDALVLTSCAGAAARSAVSAALACTKGVGGSVDVMLSGDDGLEDMSALAARFSGVRRLYAASGRPVAEAVAASAGELATQYGFVMAPATSFGKDVLPRVAGIVGGECVSEVVDVGVQTNDYGEFTHPIYAGAALARVRVAGGLRMLTARTTAFAPVAERADGGKADVESMTLSSAPGTRFVSTESTDTGRPELTTADVVVAGGRGLKSPADFQMLEQLADVLGGALGATRAAVDGGLCPNDMQIGQTGKVVAPSLYVAIGISGAIQHLAGIKDSKVIVAVNKDAEAPIFQVADYAIVGDLFDVLPQLIDALKEHKSNITNAP